MSEKLTPEQVENWRGVLLQMVGPYALIMPEAEIERFRDRMQELADESDEGRALAVGEGERGEELKA